MTSLWKQNTSLHPAFERFHRCLDEDWFLLEYEWKLQRASAAALLDAGIFSPDEYLELNRAIDELEAQTKGLEAAPEHEAEDLHTYVEAELTAKVEAGKKIHSGRSRNDQVATLLQLCLVDRAAVLAEGVHALVARLAERARGWAELEMPLQTHAQFAAPGSAGAWALRHAVAFDRDHRMLRQAIEGWKEACALGSGAVAGSSIPLDRKLLAQALGFTAPSPNSLDATGSRDETLQFLAWSVTFGLHVQSLATDLLQFMQTPFAWVRPLDGLMTGSSMMPNKSNPDGLELLRGEANALHGAYLQSLVTLKGLPSGYNRDLQTLKPVLRDAVARVEGLIQLVDRHVAALEFDEAKLAEACGQGEIQATLRMERNVLDGGNLRDAHHLEADRVADGKPGEAATFDATAYRTLGAASPSETRRVAAELLSANSTT